jgi:hypothetical protein
MSLVFEALQSLEAERYGVFRPAPPEALELLRAVERRGATSPDALPQGPDVEVHVAEAAKLFPVPSPLAACAAVAAPTVAEPLQDVRAAEAPVVGRVAAVAVELPGAAAVRSTPASAAPDSVASSGSVQTGSAGEKAAVAAPVTAAPRQDATGLGRAVAMVSAALPMVQRVLNLIDGRKTDSVAKASAEKSQTAIAVAAKPQVDLSAITSGLSVLKTQQNELREQVVEQNATLMQIAGRLEQVREATHRNIQEQKELIEDLKAVGSRINLVAVMGLSLLAISVAVELLLYLRIVKVL